MKYILENEDLPTNPVKVAVKRSKVSEGNIVFTINDIPVITLRENGHFVVNDLGYTSLVKLAELNISVNRCAVNVDGLDHLHSRSRFSFPPQTGCK